MDITSLQVCMDSSEWLQGATEEDCGMDSSSPCTGDMLTCTRPLVERRLRTPHDPALKCPRCDSTHTKFCYYNNYSLSQPRYFCKTCRRYWTKGGTLRNIPVGGGCRRNKKVSTNKKPCDNQSPNPGSSSSSHNPIDLQLSFPKLHPATNSNSNTSFMESKYNDFMERRLEAIVGSSRNNYDFMGNGDQLGLLGGLGGDHMSHHHVLAPPNIHGLCSPYDGNGGNFMDTWHHQRMAMLPYDHHAYDQGQHDAIMDVKPDTKILSLDWQDQGRSETGNGYLNNLGSWNGTMNNYTPSTTNPLV